MFLLEQGFVTSSATANVCGKPGANSAQSRFIFGFRHPTSASVSRILPKHLNSQLPNMTHVVHTCTLDRTSGTQVPDSEVSSLSRLRWPTQK